MPLLHRMHGRLRCVDMRVGAFKVSGELWENRQGNLRVDMRFISRIVNIQWEENIYYVTAESSIFSDVTEGGLIPDYEIKFRETRGKTFMVEAWAERI